MVKFIHCADLHLGATFKSVAAKCDAETKKIIADSTLLSWQKLVDKAITLKVDFVLIAGDIFDNPMPLLKQRMSFKNGVDKLSEANIRVFATSGNHDNNIKIFEDFSFSDKVKFFSAEKVETIELPELKTIVAGISYHNDNAAENLSKYFNGNNLNENYFKIALLHANIGGTSSYGDNDEIGCYSNCRLSDLSSAKFDYWALGHIHNGGILRSEKPQIVYSGSLQGLNINQDTPKGAYLVKVDESLQTEIEFIECSTIDFVSLEIDLSDVDSDRTFADKIAIETEKVAELHKNCELIFTEVTLSGRSDYCRKLLNEARQEIIQELKLIAGDRFFINNLKLNLYRKLDKNTLLANNPLLGDILSVDESGEATKTFLKEKIMILKNKFPLAEFYSEEEIDNLIQQGKETLFGIFADNQQDEVQ
ncbi:MAG: DNA repair exonuclease [Lentisphaeria bacterium]|nr:DNA repair exonuclease [Lentisphaeria bacterium]